MSKSSQQGVLSWFILISSSSTLLCCALPALMVALGAGAVFGSFVAQVPGLIWISEHKTGVFIFAGVMLTLGGFARWQAARRPCPTDPKLAHACQASRGWSKWIYFASLSAYGTGLFFAYVAPLLFA